MVMSGFITISRGDPIWSSTVCYANLAKWPHILKTTWCEHTQQKHVPITVSRISNAHPPVQAIWLGKFINLVARPRNILKHGTCVTFSMP